MRLWRVLCAKKNTRCAKHEPTHTKRSMLNAHRVPLAFKPKPVELARFLIFSRNHRARRLHRFAHGLPQRKSGRSAAHKLVSPVTTPDAGSVVVYGLFFRLYIEPQQPHPGQRPSSNQQTDNCRPTHKSGRVLKRTNIGKPCKSRLTKATRRQGTHPYVGPG